MLSKSKIRLWAVLKAPPTNIFLSSIVWIEFPPYPHFENLRFVGFNSFYWNKLYTLARKKSNCLQKDYILFFFQKKNCRNFFFSYSQICKAIKNGNFLFYIKILHLCNCFVLNKTVHNFEKSIPMFWCFLQNKEKKY